MNQALAVQEVPFREQFVWMAQEKDGEVLVPVKRLCENLGINHRNQAKKIKADPRFSWGDITSTAPDGKNYKMLCLPINQLSGWLFSINPAKVKPSVRDNLVLYQRECVKVLDSYWRKGAEARIKDLESQVKFAHLSWELVDLQAEVKELTAELKRVRNVKALPAPELPPAVTRPVLNLQTDRLIGPALLEIRALGEAITCIGVSGGDVSLWPKTLTNIGIMIADKAAEVGETLGVMEK